MSTAQQLFLIGGLINILTSVLVGYALFWTRIQDPKRRTLSGLVSHKITLWNGFLLFSLAVAIEHTGFIPQVNNLLAVAEVAISIMVGVRSIIIWASGIGNIFRQDSPFLMRSVGIGHMVDLLVVAGIFYGVARTVFGI